MEAARRQIKTISTTDKTIIFLKKEAGRIINPYLYIQVGLL